MTLQAFLEASLYLKVVRRIVRSLWYVSPVNLLGAVAKTKDIKWNWLPEVYQVGVVCVMSWVLWHPPPHLTFLVGVAFFRPGEILVFLLDWMLVEKPVVSFHRSLVGFLVNQAEVVLCFAVLLRWFGCGADSPRKALYNSLRTAVTVGPTDVIKGCEGLIGAEIVVAYLLTVLVIAAVVGKAGQYAERWDRGVRQD